MRLSKKLLIFFGIFLLTINIISFTSAIVPSECEKVEICLGPVCIKAPFPVCKKIVNAETETIHVEYAIFNVRNIGAGEAYFAPYRSYDEVYAFLESARANPYLNVVPDIANMCFKQCAKEGGTCSPGKTYVFYASKNVRLVDSVYKMTVSEGASRTRYAYSLTTGSIGCNNGVFGDPRPGYTKYCYIPVACLRRGGIDANDDGKISTTEYNQAVQTGNYPEETILEVGNALAKTNNNVISYSTFLYGSHTYTVYKGAETGTVIVYRDNNEGLGATNTGVYLDMGGGNYGWVDTSGNVHPLTTDKGEDNPDKFNNDVQETITGIDKCRYVVCGSKEYCDSNTGNCKSYSNTDSGGGSNTCTRCSYTPLAGASCYSYETYSC